MTIDVLDSFSACLAGRSPDVGGWILTDGWVPRSSLPDQGTLRASWVPVAENAGLRLGKANLERSRSSNFGRTLITDDRRELKRKALYAVVEPADACAATVAMIDSIVASSGAGYLWFAGEPGFLVSRSQPKGTVPLRGMGIELTDDPDHPGFSPTADVPRRVLMGCYYFHDAIVNTISERRAS